MSLGWYYILDVPVFELNENIFIFSIRIVLTTQTLSGLEVGGGLGATESEMEGKVGDSERIGEESCGLKVKKTRS